MSYTLTLRVHDLKSCPVGFNRQSGNLQIPYVKYNDTLRQHIQNLNQYRMPESQIKHIYNSVGEEIDPSLWGLKIIDNITLYVDRPQR